MMDLKTTLTEIISRPVEGRGAARIAVVIRTVCGGDVREGAALSAGDQLGVLEPWLHAAQADRGRGCRDHLCHADLRSNCRAAWAPQNLCARITGGPLFTRTSVISSFISRRNAPRRTPSLPSW